MGFGEIRDQDSAVVALTRAVETDKVPHAYLFEGPAGVGKRLTARALALALNCEERGADSCGVCEGCRKITAGVHPDVRWLTLTEGKRRIPIDAVREAERWIAVRPHEGLAKVLIVEPAEQMSDQAANALLKTLEEPRPGSFLVLVTARASSLLPTVRSRCQRIRFGPLDRGTVADLLVLQGAAPEEADLVAALSEGSLERAAGFLGDELGDRIDRAMTLAEGAVDRLPLDGMSVAASMRGDRDEVLAVLELLLVVLDEVLWVGSGAGSDGAGRGLAERLGDRFERLVAGMPNARAAQSIAAAQRAVAGIERNNMNPQLAVEGVLMAMRGRGDRGTGWGRIGERR
jgi:DNA polymerase-3 subunit delta'